jgi:hypothetical protein
MAYWNSLATRFLSMLYHYIGSAEKPWELADGGVSILTIIQEVLGLHQLCKQEKSRHDLLLVRQMTGRDIAKQQRLRCMLGCSALVDLLE